MKSNNFNNYYLYQEVFLKKLNVKVEKLIQGAVGKLHGFEMLIKMPQLMLHNKFLLHICKVGDTITLGTFVIDTINSNNPQLLQ